MFRGMNIMLRVCNLMNFRFLNSMVVLSQGSTLGLAQQPVSLIAV